MLIGRSTHRLVRDAVEVEPLAPLELKGKSEPIPAFRVVRVVEGAAPIARRADTPCSPSWTSGVVQRKTAGCALASCRRRYAGDVAGVPRHLHKGEER